MTNEEVNEFGINIVLEDLRKNGFIISAVTTDRHSNPQIVAKSNGQLFHIVVRRHVIQIKETLKAKN
jgi:hypothetical protein